MSTKVTIIVPNWNGKAFLNRCLAAILHSAVEYGAPFECLLMDDASTDGSAEQAHQQFPMVKLVKHERNLGFGQMVNRAAKIAEGDILLLVNNDLVARPDFVRHLCEHYETSADLFGVSGKTIDWDSTSPNHVNMRGRFSDGQLQLTWSDDEALTETMFLQGGSCAVKKALFLEFGGFHHLYSPGYWEDYDVSYQALKAGYRNLYDPRAVGSHLGQGSMIRAHGQERIDFVRERNRFLLLALNLTDEEYFKAFWSNLPTYIRHGHGSTLRFKLRMAVLSYLLRNASAIKDERMKRAQRQKFGDADIFARFAGLGTLC